MSRYWQCTIAALGIALMPLRGLAEDPRVETLERQLRERDKVILELLERVEALERRVGLNPPAEETPDAPPAGHDGSGSSADVTRPSGAPRDMPGAVAVDEGAAERALERSLTQAGALLLSPGQAELEPRVTYARREEAAPAFITSADGVLAAERERDVDTLTADLALRIGLPWDSQAEAGIPYRWREIGERTLAGFSPLDTASRSGSGAGDIRLGIAKTLIREGLWRPDVIGRITWDTDTGDETDDGVPLGGGFNELRGSLTAINRQDPVVFAGNVAYEYSFESDDVKPGDVISASAGGFVALSPETSLRLLLAAAYQDETEVLGSAVDGTDQVLGSFVIGGSSLLGPGFLIDLSTSIGLTRDADDFSVTLSTPIRFR